MICCCCKKELTKRHKVHDVEFWDVFHDAVCSKCIGFVIKHSRGIKDALQHERWFGYKKWMVDMRKRHFVKKWKNRK